MESLTAKGIEANREYFQTLLEKQYTKYMNIWEKLNGYYSEELEAIVEGGAGEPQVPSGGR
jgi:hypothetical protein